MQVLRTRAELEGFLGRPGVRDRLVLAPTMGALHEGHATLVRRGRVEADRRGFAGGCVVTIFVNPTQFNNPADLERYPRTLDADVRLCAAAGASAVFAPGVEDVYPDGVQAWKGVLPLVAVRPGLEDAFRPGHFAGVCQVVKRLFELCRPGAAVFGEKDWQQLQVVRAMTVQEGLGVEIVPESTVREAGGLAMSSRNRFLAPEERGRALALSRALRAAGAEGTVESAERAMRRELDSAGVRTEYAVVRDAATLEPVAGGALAGRSYRALIAAEVGSVRLIDNAAWPEPQSGGG